MNTILSPDGDTQYTFKRLLTITGRDGESIVIGMELEAVKNGETKIVCMYGR